MSEPLSFDKAHSALLVMDYQKEIVSNFTGNDPNLLQRASTVLNAVRAAGLPVIYVVVRFRPGYPEISPANKVLGRIRAAGLLVEGSPGSQIHPQLEPQADEVVVTKRRTGAFSTTDLATILKAREITSLILMGLATSGVVLSTVRWAADADYELIVLEDCCSDRDEEVHSVLMTKVFPGQARVVSSNELTLGLQS
jgi:nicotinamidase-related amidase